MRFGSCTELTNRRVVLERPVIREKVKALVLEGLSDAEIARQVSTARAPVTRAAVQAFRKRRWV